MDLAHWFNQTLTYASRTGVNSAGDPTYATQATVSCRFQDVTRLRRAQASGTAAEAKATIYTLANTLRKGDRIWLPGADTGRVDTSREVLEVSDSPDKDGQTPQYRITFE